MAEESNSKLIVLSSDSESEGVNTSINLLESLRISKAKAYREKAKEYSERIQLPLPLPLLTPRMMNNSADDNDDSPPELVPVPTQLEGKDKEAAAPPKNPKMTLDPEVLKKEMDDNRKTVMDLFQGDSDNWLTEPITICTLNMYLDLEKPAARPEPEAGPAPAEFGTRGAANYIPGEIGLSTFTIRDGMIDNFAKVFQPDLVPRKFRDNAFYVRVSELGLPIPRKQWKFDGSVDTIMRQISSYLKKHQGPFQKEKGVLALFVLDTDFDITRQCFHWLNAKSRYPFEVKILSLSLFAFIASAGIPVTEYRIELFWKRVNKLKERPEEAIEFTPDFKFPPCFPFLKYGYFICDYQADKVLKTMDSYQHLEEISCVYHYKKGIGCRECALNTSNRYVFMLLQVVTIDKNIEIQPGAHFPEVADLEKEKKRRHGWLKSWISADSIEWRVRDYHGNPLYDPLVRTQGPAKSRDHAKEAVGLSKEAPKPEEEVVKELVSDPKLD